MYLVIEQLHLSMHYVGHSAGYVVHLLAERVDAEESHWPGLGAGSGQIGLAQCIVEEAPSIAYGAVEVLVELHKWKGLFLRDHSSLFGFGIGVTLLRMFGK